MKRGFTIVELLMSIAIISVLATIVTTASVSALRSSRARRTEAMRLALQTAIATYHAQDSDERWPDPIESLAGSGKSGVLSESQAQEVFREIVRRSVKKGAGGMPLINPAGLFVSPNGGTDGKKTGLGYAEARKGGAHRRKLGLNDLEFGYQGRLSGKFHRFNIIYRAETDSVVVSVHCHNCCSVENDGTFHDESEGNYGTCGNSDCPICHEGRRK